MPLKPKKLPRHIAHRQKVERERQERWESHFPQASPGEFVKDAPVLNVTGAGSTDNNDNFNVAPIASAIHEQKEYPEGPETASCSLGLILNGDGDNVYLSIGAINAGGTHEIVGGEDTTITPTVGNIVYAEVELEAELTDGGAFNGSFTADSAAIVSASSVPDDHSWTSSAASGKSYRALGTWVADGEGDPKWQGFGCGDVTFKLCFVTTDSADAHSYRS